MRGVAPIFGARGADARDAELRAEIDEELRFHVEETAAELVRDGWEPAAARSAAAESAAAERQSTEYDWMS